MSEAFVHPQGLCESKRVGARTRIWAFAHVLPGAQIGADCNICDHTFIENDVVLGDRVTIKCGVQLWDGLRLGDDVFVGPNVTFTNDPAPRSRQRPAAFAQTIIERGASIGANATILPGLRIGENAMVGAGAVITRSVPPNAIVTGNPARISGYVGLEASPAEPFAEPAPQLTELRVDGARHLPFKRVHDLRGDLAVGEFGQQIPFQAKRFFLVFNVPSKEVRGEHAHRRCAQVLVCVRGSCTVVVDDGTHRQAVVLDRPDVGLYIAPMVFGIQYKFSDDACLLVFASEVYDADDYIRTYAEFKQLKSAGR